MSDSFQDAKQTFANKDEGQKGLTPELTAHRRRVRDALGSICASVFKNTLGLEHARSVETGRTVWSRGELDAPRPTWPKLRPTSATCQGHPGRTDGLRT